MITYSKKQKYKIVLKGFFDSQHKKLNNDLISNEEGSFSTISEINTIYLCLGKEKEITIKKIEDLIFPAFLTKRYDIDVDLLTFETNKIKSKEIFNKLLETFYYLRHNQVSYKQKPKKTSEKKINFILNNEKKELDEIFKTKKITMESVNLARDLQDKAPNFLTPKKFVDDILHELKEIKSLKLEILDKKQIEKEKMNLLLSVNSGSTKEPRVLIIKYFGNKNSKKTTALIGKGITFDSGGYSLKPANYQIDMKFDMSGAAIVSSTMKAIAKLELPINVISISCLTENLIGSTATLVESVIKSKSGLTVEITNTDAEGRLVLADGITYAIENLKVDEIIELSTLTGAISYTLGGYMSGLFSNDDKLANKFLESSKISGEEIWRLPVHKQNFEYMKDSKIADLLNSSKEYKGASSNAAAFLFSFAKKTPFIHLDIAGTADKNHRGTGVLVKTLIQFFKKK